eukprot:c51243_g1_i1 orf=320-538(+)
MDSVSALHVVVCLGVGVMGGFAVGLYFSALEHLWYRFFRFLDNRKLIKRLAEHIPITDNNYASETFWAVSTT